MSWPKRSRKKTVQPERKTTEKQEEKEKNPTPEKEAEEGTGEKEGSGCAQRQLARETFHLLAETIRKKKRSTRTTSKEYAGTKECRSKVLSPKEATFKPALRGGVVRT